MTGENECIFCNIVAGKMPCFKFHEDDQTLGFMDAFPAAEGHALIVPKSHWTDVFAIDDESVRGVASVVRCAAAAVHKVLKPDGLNIVQANGEAAGQTVFHYHVHLLPRTAGEKLRMHGKERGDDARLKELATAYARAIDDAE